MSCQSREFYNFVCTINCWSYNTSCFCGSISHFCENLFREISHHIRTIRFIHFPTKLDRRKMTWRSSLSFEITSGIHSLTNFFVWINNHWILLVLGFSKRVLWTRIICIKTKIFKIMDNPTIRDQGEVFSLNQETKGKVKRNFRKFSVFLFCFDFRT